jgi:hypothetical protein
LHAPRTANLSIKRRPKLPIVVCLIVLAALCTRSEAAIIRVPVEVDYLVLDAALKQRLYTAAGGRAEFWKGPDGCGYFYGRNPRFGRNQGAVKLETDGNLNLGLGVAGQCLSALEWSGIIEAETAPYIDGFALKFRVTDINFYNPDRTQGAMASRAFGLVKQNLIPRLETFTYDAKPYMERLYGVLNSAPPSSAGAQARAALTSVRLAREVIAEDDGVGLTLEVTVPEDLMREAAAYASVPLTPAQVDAWRIALRNADQFLSVAAGQMRGLVPDEQLRRELAGVLADARNRAERAAERPPPGGDPLPIFRQDWERLRLIIKTAAHRGTFGDQAVELLSFVSVGGAMFALDMQVPALGARISRAGLGELSRRSEDGAASSRTPPPRPASGPGDSPLE